MQTMESIKFFSKVESKIILFIFLVLFLVSGYNMLISLRRGRDSIRKNDISAIENSLDTYLQKYKIYPLSTTDGKIISEHEGLSLYTLGQRQGININNGPYYVIKKDLIKNSSYTLNLEKKKNILSYLESKKKIALLDDEDGMVDWTETVLNEANGAIDVEITPAMAMPESKPTVETKLSSTPKTNARKYSAKAFFEYCLNIIKPPASRRRRKTSRRSHSSLLPKPETLPSPILLPIFRFF